MLAGYPATFTAPRGPRAPKSKERTLPTRSAAENAVLDRQFAALSTHPDGKWEADQWEIYWEIRQEKHAADRANLLRRSPARIPGGHYE